jgi:hypothetical protein
MRAPKVDGESVAGPRLCSNIRQALGQKTSTHASGSDRIDYMKMKSFFLTFGCVLALTATGVFAASLSKTVAQINADAAKEGGPAKVLESMAKSTGVSAATLEKQKSKTGLSYGDIFAAHSIAKASGKSFDEIVALKKKGQTWDQIAEANGVETGGKKKTASGPSPTPTPTAPQRRLSDEMKDRYK